MKSLHSDHVQSCRKLVCSNSNALLATIGYAILNHATILSLEYIHSHSHTPKTDTNIPTAKVKECRHSNILHAPFPRSVASSTTTSTPSQSSSRHHGHPPLPLRHLPYHQHRPPDCLQNHPNPAADVPSLSGRRRPSVSQYCQSDCWVQANDATKVLQMSKESHLRTRRRWLRRRRRAFRARGCRSRWLRNLLFADYGGRGGRPIGGGRAMVGG